MIRHNGFTVLALLNFGGLKKRMYLRNLVEKSIAGSKPDGRLRPAVVIIFAFILLIALFASSLTDKETAGFQNREPASSQLRNVPASVNSAGRKQMAGCLAENTITFCSIIYTGRLECVSII